MDRHSHIYKVHHVDARKISEIIKTKIVDVTITSPPYFDLKDYGYKHQIGYGQKYGQYLDDLKTVFKNVYDCTKDTGTLWVIIDAFKKNGEVIPLPFDFSNKIRESGWKLQEVIIWGKDRTVPWTHKGQMRNLFEYILVFSKTDKYNFYVDQVRDFESLKKWWVKYPERYNPKGKTPAAIWNFDIPTQGSWGNGYIKHFCPLPEEMIAQILKLTSKEGDVVMDPFSGSGSVLAKADNMRRKYIGFELNAAYIKMFSKFLSETGVKKRAEYDRKKKNNLEQKQFRDLIINLRLLKYGRLILEKVNKNKTQGIKKIYVEKTKLTSDKKFSLASANYYIYISKPSGKENIKQTVLELVKKAPLSKFGIDPNFILIDNEKEFLSAVKNKFLYEYSIKNTHKFTKKISQGEIFKSPSEVVLSRIMVDLNEKDHE